MKLVDFSVTNYRSITKAHKITLQNLTVLTGKNNEGKSNLLNALNIAMRAMIYHARGRIVAPQNRRGIQELFYWDRDFPIQLRERKSGLESIFRLNFRFEATEATDFYMATGIRSNENVPIEIKFGKENLIKISVPKRGASSFSEKSEQVTSFICGRISFNYIQAVRTEEMALNVLQSIIANAFDDIEKIPAYITAMETIDRLQQEVCNSIAERILVPLQEFLPLLTDIRIEKSRDRTLNRFMRNEFDIILNDGIPTSIGFKGDGIKSLVALAILKDIQTTDGASIIAIEEPESHLHPSAIHGLVNVINSIAETHQVIISTHNPLFVQRNNIKSNIIVNAGTAQSAKTIKEVRDVLGVLPADNLINASHVLVVEGDDDRIAFGKILLAASPKLKAALQKNILVIQSIAGAGNLSYELSRLRSFLCKYFVFMDADEAGYRAVSTAIEHGYITEAEVKYSICNGQDEAEFEDCLNSELYANAIRDNYTVDIRVAAFRGNEKWSNRLKNTFLSQGQRWTESIEKKVKLLIAESIPDSLESVFIPEKRGSIDSLIVALEELLD